MKPFQIVKDNLGGRSVLMAFMSSKSLFIVKEVPPAIPTPMQLYIDNETDEVDYRGFTQGRPVSG
jgi:hypothetical protein